MTTKSYEEFVLGLYRAMLVDIAEFRPELRVECDRDYKRLLSGVEHRGLPFVWVDLPAFGKHFDKCLSEGLLTPSGLAHMRPYKRRVAIPRLFKGLLLRVFNPFGVLRSDPDKHAIRYVRQLCSVVKRFRVTCPDSSTRKKVDEFFRIDGDIISSSLSWSANSMDVDDASSLSFRDSCSPPSSCEALVSQGAPETLSVQPALLDTLDSVSCMLSAQIGQFSPSEYQARHGPGAVSDLRSGEYKYSFPTWSDKLDYVFSSSEFAFANFDCWVRNHLHGGPVVLSTTEPPARLLAVPKTYAGPRLIASEPTSHQWCQQIIRAFLVDRMSKSSIRHSVHFDDQSYNQRLALEASRSGSHSTIDLSDASDRISCWVVERLFRNSGTVLSAFHAVRTRTIKQEIDKKLPKLYELRKFSTMGSAITFPVQTFLFTVVAISAILFVRNRRVSYRSIEEASREVSVFGDDIVIPIDCHDETVALLTHLRLKVNLSKTYATGKFRESCGLDAYDGFDVSKVSVLSEPSVSKPDSVLSSVDVSNNLLLAGYIRTSAFVRKTVESLRRFVFREVTAESGALGWVTFGPPDLSSLMRRFNVDLQRSEVRVTQPRGSVFRTPVESDAMLLQYFTEVKGPPKESSDRLGCKALRGPLMLRRTWVPVL